MQLACTIYGKLAWISDPVNGSRHDNYCQEESGVLLTMSPKNWIGDKGYIGNNMITPYRKPAGGELLDWQKEYNSQVNKIRWMIEQVISHFKNWTIRSVIQNPVFRGNAVHSRASEEISRHAAEGN